MPSPRPARGRSRRRGRRAASRAGASSLRVRGARHGHGNFLPPREPRLELVPVMNLRFALLPAPENVAAVELAVEVHQAVGKALENAADLVQLFDAVVDPRRDHVDLLLEIELLLRLAPLGA